MLMGKKTNMIWFGNFNENELNIVLAYQTNSDSEILLTCLEFINFDLLCITLLTEYLITVISFAHSVNIIFGSFRAS